MEASLNGVRLSTAQAGKAYAAGMLAGALDINLPVARGPYHGMRIEMKFGKGRMTDDQKWYAARLVELGWYVVTCWDWEEAREEIIDYLTQKDLFPRAAAVHTCERCGFKTVEPASESTWQDDFFGSN